MGDFEIMSESMIKVEEEEHDSGEDCGEVSSHWNTLRLIELGATEPMKEENDSQEEGTQSISQLSASIFGSHTNITLGSITPHVTNAGLNDINEHQKLVQMEEKSVRRRSALWLYFIAISSDKAKCGICNSVLSYKGTTSNLRKHLAKKHHMYLDDSNFRAKRKKIEIERCEQRPEDEDDLVPVSTTTANTSNMALSYQFQSPASRSSGSILPFTTHPLPIARQKKITSLVMNMIITDLQPFCIVEDKGFMQLIGGIEPSYQLPSHSVFSQDILPQFYDDVFAKLRSKLGDAEHVTLATDSWTSVANEQYISITSFHITKSWDMFCGLLECFKFSDMDTGENIANEIKRITDKWGITDKVFVIVTDNAENMVAVARATCYTHLRCFVHTLNLVVQDGLKTLATLHEKVRGIIEHFHRSFEATEKLAAQLQYQGMSSSLKLKNDITTSWKSTYCMFEWLCEVQALGVLQHSVNGMSDKDWAVLREVCNLLKPFEQVSVELSGEKCLSVSKVILIVRGLASAINKLRSISTQSDAVHLGDSLLKSLSNLFSVLENDATLIRASFLDPRFKERAFTSDVALEMAKNLISEDLNELMKIEDSSLIEQEQYENDGCTGREDLVWEDFDTSVSVRKPSQAVEIKNIIRQYCEEPNISRKENPLTWWNNREVLYPHLAKLAKKYLGVVATSVPSERMFSKSGQIFTERRIRLKSSNVEKLVFLNCNKSLIDSA